MNVYLQTKTQFPPSIFKRPSLNLGLIVVIPASNEPFLLLCLLQLKKCKLPDSDVEVIVVLHDAENSSEEIKQVNRDCFETTLQWAKVNSQPRLKFQILYFNELPKYNASTSLARKIGMDEACWRFEKARNPEGIITCLDPGSKCEADYFLAIESHFKKNQKCQAACVYFEFPLSGPDFPETVYNTLLKYELQLRYLVEALHWTGFPFALLSIDSCIAIRWKAYMNQGGLPLKNQGKSSSFLDTFFEDKTAMQINSTRLLLSPETTVKSLFNQEKGSLNILKTKEFAKTFHPEAFIILKKWIEEIGGFLLDHRSTKDSLHPSLQTFLENNNFQKWEREIINKTPDERTMYKELFKWFNPAMSIKFLNHHRSYKADIEILKASRWLIDQYENVFDTPENERDCLNWFRKRQRKGAYLSDKKIKAGN
jgi:hypothetical protein